MTRQYWQSRLHLNSTQKTYRRWPTETLLSTWSSGEKAPALAQKTLSLPPIQSDNSAQIVELSRRSYSREREIVEAEIRTLLEKATPQQQPPQPAKTGSVVLCNLLSLHTKATHKKKRTRSRSRKKNPQIQML